MQMIKGGGAALTREKIIASVADKFICIADASKQVDILGKFPLPVEVIPMARSAVARQLVKLGGRPEYRQGVVTDNGNVILDVHGTEILDAIALENAINGIPRRRHRGAVRQPWRRRGADWHCRRREDHRKIVCPQEPTGSLANIFHQVQFGDFCHIYATILIYTLPFLLFLVFCPAISLWMTFLQDGDANVHIAAIVFDMLLRRTFVQHDIS